MAKTARKKVTTYREKEVYNEETNEWETKKVATKSKVEYEISEDRWERYYYSYVRMYEKKKQQLAKRGEMMFEELLDEDSYRRERTIMIQEGVEQNVNRTMVQGQATYMDYSGAKRLLEIAKDYDLDFAKTVTDDGEERWLSPREMMRMDPGELGLMDVRQQVDEDVFDQIVSEINEKLKQAHPTWNGRQRAAWISHEVYGS